MILRGGRVATGARSTEIVDLGIERGRLRIPAGSCPGPEIDCRGLLILPGLINAHDHLEFNLFPRLGNGPYRNASEWAHDIYRPHEEPVRSHLRVPKRARLIWGGLKNLLCGVTTVMHHNPYDEVFDAGFPVRVVKKYGWAHSVTFSRDYAERHAATPAAFPFVIHAGEGTDGCAAEEIRLLDARGVLAGNTVIAHAVGADSPGLELIRRRKAAIIWCPTSNFFVLRKTVSDELLGAGIPIALGTDSAISAAGDMQDEVDSAARIAGRERVYRMVTSDAAAILRLGGGEGAIRAGGVADLAAFRDRGQVPCEALAALSPEMVVVDGSVRLLSLDMARSRTAGLIKGGQQLGLEDRGEWIVDGDAAACRDAAVPFVGPNLFLAGRRIL
jgi:cytosine/adenosine deaminase-related metal-dependent hydrolase